MPAKKPKYRQRKTLNENVYSRLDAADKEAYAESFVRKNNSLSPYGLQKAIPNIKTWEDRNVKNIGTKLNP